MPFPTQDLSTSDTLRDALHDVLARGLAGLPGIPSLAGNAPRRRGRGHRNDGPRSILLRGGLTDEVEVRALTWLPGAATGWHDHGESDGAYLVVSGALTERGWESTAGQRGLETVRPLGEGQGRGFDGHHVHDLRNDSDQVAVSLHAYAPRLHTRTRYAVHGGRLSVLGVEEVA